MKMVRSSQQHTQQEFEGKQTFGLHARVVSKLRTPMHESHVVQREGCITANEILNAIRICNILRSSGLR